MVPAGYMYKLVSAKAADSPPANIIDYYSVGICGADISPFFTDYIPHWKHNGYWLFDSPEVMQEIAARENINLDRMTLFFYETYEFQFNLLTEAKTPNWSEFKPDAYFITNIRIPNNTTLAGYDVVQYCSQAAPECSLLSCSGLAEKFVLNDHCLFNTLELAKNALETGLFNHKEPGPYRIHSVYVCQ